eukprot:GHVR01116184.1.p1 GENE.GHVR01116184.1~~GHVR01116184.1.p1  ORF type:complete len:120 (+),score=10.30 GHVR01116184.1:1062-1421(+)
MLRNNEYNFILHGRHLGQQFIVDMYAKIESESLNFLKYNQPQLKVAQNGLVGDAIANDGNANNIGQVVIFPSSFTGGPRYMHERTQDAMCYVRRHGPPDLFITFTCNTKWEEIQDNLQH